MAIDDLFTPYEHADLKVPHRVAMAPLTRNRAKGTVPGPLIAEYYAQRASAAIIVTEGTQPESRGQGYLDTPGIHTDAQQAGWAGVVQAVRAAGDARFVIQVMHTGRLAHPYYSGGQPEAPSAVTAAGEVITPEGKQPHVEPKALDAAGLERVKASFVEAARRAVAAGADGIELHAANGYLLHQFLSDVTNVRTDEYGGSPEARARFVLEVVDAVVEAVGERHTAIRLSPGHAANDLSHTDVEATFDAVYRGLAAHDLLYVHVLDSSPDAGYPVLAQARRLYPGTLMVNEGFSEEFTPEEAGDLVASGKADLVAYGRRFIANPDLPRRLREGAPLNEAERTTFYGGGAEGYTDYPALTEVSA